MPFSVPNKKPLEIRNCLDGDYRREFEKDIRAGMTSRRKRIPSKYFYDSRGSDLFCRICHTPEYYLTKTELSLLNQSAPAIMAFFNGKGGDLVELGSGSNRKVRKLLDAVSEAELERIRYVSMDISVRALIESLEELQDLYQNLDILAIIADFSRHMGVLPARRKMITFFGSTIGNFSEKERLDLLKNIRNVMDSEDIFVLGIDMLKPVSILEAAYNDAQGLTRAFNLNILSNINSELNADFSIEDFEHLAFFNPEKEGIEMHLRANRDLSAFISDLSLNVDLAEGETIHTEVCNKFSLEGVTKQFDEAGLVVSRWFTDPKAWFSLVELKTAD